jgi:cytochrome o ubiquinol oxidase subunit 3
VRLEYGSEILAKVKVMTMDALTLDLTYTEEPEHPDMVPVHTFGFWIYLMSDLILFAALFATFGVLGNNYAGGPTGRDVFDLPYTFVETLILLLSSAVCGLAMLAVHNGTKRLVVLGFAATFMLGLGFIFMEVNEFHRMIAAGNGPERSAFFSAFFTLVGTHGTHVAFGLLWMAVMMGQVAAKGLTSPVRSRLMRLSMFWHFLDVVWIGIFTFVYLMEVM